MTDNKCTCAVCRGFEPWRTDFAECMITRFIKTGHAVQAGEACNIVEGHDLTCGMRVIEREWAEAMGEMNTWHARWGWDD